MPPPTEPARPAPGPDVGGRATDEAPDSVATVPDVTGPARGTAAVGPLLQSMRPRQWVKNLLVVAAPLAAGVILEPGVWGPTLAVLVAFCLGASSLYLVNDLADVAQDRRHPRKRHRPIAAGRLSARTAGVGAVVLGVGAVVLAAAVNPASALVMVLYLGLGLLYTWRLKHEVVLDLAIVASGFLLRAVAGGVATGLPLSEWFLIVAGFGSLFIVAGKRASELETLGSAADTRRTLVRYSAGYLRFVWGLAAGAAVLAYCLWAFEQSAAGAPEWLTVSIIPFVLGILRYAADIDAGAAGEPEDVVLRDRVLQLVGLVWLTTVCLGVLGG